MPTEFAFVTEDGHGKPKKAERLLIRKHCMQGKNVQCGSRRSSARRIRRPPSSAAVESARNNRPITPNYIENEAETSSRLPLPPPTDVALIRVPNEVDVQSQELLYNFFTFDSIKIDLFPVERYVNFAEWETDMAIWFFTEDVFFHTVLLSASAHRDYMLAQPLTKSSRVHLRHVISALNKKLSEAHNGLLSYPTLFVVIILVHVATMFGDYSAAIAHLAGLQQMVKLLGGLTWLQSDPKTHYKIDRVDFSWALCTGNKACFLSEPVSWSSIFPKPRPASLTPFCEYSLHGIIPERLIVVFEDLRQLARLINEEGIREEKVSGKPFQIALTSIQSRLLQLQDAFDDDVSECLRLGMLAYLATTMQIPGKRGPYPYLEEHFRARFQNIEATRDLRDILVWLLMVGTLVLFDMGESWISERW
ncbi:hypothetical protein CC78DRAFT_501132, partial [Lojkania enalia]